MLLRLIVLLSDAYWREEIPAAGNEACLIGEAPNLYKCSDINAATRAITHLIRRACQLPHISTSVDLETAYSPAVASVEYQRRPCELDIEPGSKLFHKMPRTSLGVRFSKTSRQRYGNTVIDAKWLGSVPDWIEPR